MDCEVDVQFPVCFNLKYFSRLLRKCMTHYCDNKIVYIPLFRASPVHRGVVLTQFELLNTSASLNAILHLEVLKKKQIKM